MSEFSLTPEAASVLLDHLDSEGMVSCISQFPPVSSLRYEMLSAEFARRGLMRGSFRLDNLRLHRLLRQILQPMLEPRQVLVLASGKDKQQTFNASVHFSDSGVTALVNGGSNLRFVQVSGPDQLAELLPDVRRLMGDASYFSYVILEDGTKTTHVGQFSAEKCQWSIQEAKNCPDQPLQQKAVVLTPAEYAASLYRKWEVMYHVHRR